MKAYIFPGQGAQAVGMGKELCELSETAKEYFGIADDILGYKISDLLFEGTAAELKQTKVTQVAVFIYSVVKARITRDFKPDMVAGHSLGEFSALSAIRAITFADGLRLIAKRAEAMQKACDAQPSMMAAVLGLDDDIIENVCKQISEEEDTILVPANYNCPGQLAISGTVKAIDIAKIRMKEAGARTVLPLRVNGAFHSPLMNSASEELNEVIEKINIRTPKIPIYQNASATPTTDPEVIRENLMAHLTSPVKWTQIIENMAVDGARQFIEVGPKPILQSMVKRINKRLSAAYI